MRINEKTYPAYNALENNIFNLEIDEMFFSKYNNSFVSELQSIYKKVNKKYYITEPFKNAIEVAFPKIQKENKHLSELTYDCGILFTSSGFTLYDITTEKATFYGFTRNILTTYGCVGQGQGSDGNNFDGIASCLRDGKPYNDTMHLFHYINSVLTTLYFIDNCEIEQKILKPQEKYKHNGAKYLNEIKSDITVLDCRWFTELIRDAPFHVRGHLRWQVHGERKAKRKLIWISDFEKQGYHRKAEKTITE